jgi:hypothetical protein
MWQGLKTAFPQQFEIFNRAVLEDSKQCLDEDLVILATTIKGQRQGSDQNRIPRCMFISTIWRIISNIDYCCFVVVVYYQLFTMTLCH